MRPLSSFRGGRPPERVCRRHRRLRGWPPDLPCRRHCLPHGLPLDLLCHRHCLRRDRPPEFPCVGVSCCRPPELSMNCSFTSCELFCFGLLVLLFGFVPHLPQTTDPLEWWKSRTTVFKKICDVMKMRLHSGNFSSIGMDLFKGRKNNYRQLWKGSGAYFPQCQTVRDNSFRSGLVILNALICELYFCIYILDFCFVDSHFFFCLSETSLIFC